MPALAASVSPIQDAAQTAELSEDCTAYHGAVLGDQPAAVLSSEIMQTSDVTSHYQAHPRVIKSAFTPYDSTFTDQCLNVLQAMIRLQHIEAGSPLTFTHIYKLLAGDILPNSAVNSMPHNPARCYCGEQHMLCSHCTFRSPTIAMLRPEGLETVECERMLDHQIMLLMAAVHVKTAGGEHSICHRLGTAPDTFGLRDICRA